jgi:hypothetical protein
MAVVYAVGTLTAAGNAANTETVTVGGKVYTFQDTLTNTDGTVKVGASAAASLQNLYDAINLTASAAGTGYAAATTANSHVTATSVTTTTLVVKSKVPGLIGNLIASTETGGSLSWGAAVLASGSGSVYDDIRTELAKQQLPVGISQFLTDLTDPLGTS